MHAYEERPTSLLNLELLGYDVENDNNEEKSWLK